MPPIVATLLLFASPCIAAAAASAAEQLQGKAGADEVAKPPRTDVAGRVGTPAA